MRMVLEKVQWAVVLRSRRNGPKVPVRWTTLRESHTLFARDSAFIKSQIQAIRQTIPEKPSWKSYCEEGALIMADLIHDNCSLGIRSKVVVAAMKGKRLPRCSSQLLIRKPPALEALNALTTTSSRLPPLQIEVITLDDELTVAAQEAGESSKRSKGKKVVAGEGSSVDCYTAKYMKAPYTLPNCLSIEEGHLWNKHMEAFHAVHQLLSAKEGRKHPAGDPIDAFAFSTLYMIKALNASYASTRRELLKDASSEKMQEDLEAAQVSLKEMDEELNSCKEALSAEEAKCHKLREGKQAMELQHAKNCSTLEAELEKLKRDQSTLLKDVEDSRLARLEAIKRAEIAEDVLSKQKLACRKRMRKLPGFVAKFLGDCPQLAGMFGQLKSEWPDEYFEGLSVALPAEDVEVSGEPVMAPGEQVMAPGEGVEATLEGEKVVEGEVANDDV
ncbi:hypothetical protein LIER_01264 [Lithospermum erythrorhizon]|uniref:Uncharacterized protein n=1 Tax=Lithospermum erythrorhizon TaxID=34254 RepID=A0AAV3NL20_LITER